MHDLREKLVEMIIGTADGAVPKGKGQIVSIDKKITIIRSAPNLTPDARNNAHTIRSTEIFAFDLLFLFVEHAYFIFYYKKCGPDDEWEETDTTYEFSSDAHFYIEHHSRYFACDPKEENWPYPSFVEPDDIATETYPIVWDVWMRRYMQRVHDAAISDVIAYSVGAGDVDPIYREIEARFFAEQPDLFRTRLVLELAVHKLLNWIERDKHWRLVFDHAEYECRERARHDPEASMNSQPEDEDFRKRQTILFPVEGQSITPELYGEDGWLLKYGPELTLEAFRIQLSKEKGVPLAASPHKLFPYPQVN